MALERELAYFEAHKSELLSTYQGQFALIYGDELLGTYTRFEEAFEAGVARLGNESFLVQPIVENAGQVQFPALAVGLLRAHP